MEKRVEMGIEGGGGGCETGKKERLKWVGKGEGEYLENDGLGGGDENA